MALAKSAMTKNRLLFQKRSSGINNEPERNYRLCNGEGEHRTQISVWISFASAPDWKGPAVILTTGRDSIIN